MNICIVHIQGGEVSGSIDESARHAITKFAHFHVPSTVRSAEYLVRMGEDPDTILTIGCPSSDLARSLNRTLTPEMINISGSGVWVDVESLYLLAVFHPTTTQFGGEVKQMRELLDGLHRLSIPTVLLWPNIDAGSNHISKTIRIFRSQNNPSWLRLVVNLTPENYLRVLANAACAIGNSSSFVRDAGFLGTPVVLVGERQDGREMGPHVRKVTADAEAIFRAVRQQLDHGRFAPCKLYGDGRVSERIADRLATLHPYSQKQLHYVREGVALAAAAI